MIGEQCWSDGRVRSLADPYECAGDQQLSECRCEARGNRGAAPNKYREPKPEASSATACEHTEDRCGNHVDDEKDAGEEADIRIAHAEFLLERVDDASHEVAV